MTKTHEHEPTTYKNGNISVRTSQQWAISLGFQYIVIVQ